MDIYSVIYAGGESRKEPGKACDYMLVNLDDDNELYAECVYPDNVECGSPGYDELETQYEAELREEIINQAAEYGIKAEQLIF